MTNDEYVAMQTRLQLLAQAALGIDPDELLEFVRLAERAISLGPVLDPTAWSAGHVKLRTVIDHARALYAFRLSVEP